MNFTDFQEALIIVAGDGLAVILIFATAGMILLSILIVVFNLSRMVWNIWRER